MYTKLISSLINAIEESDRLAFALAFGLGPWVVPVGGGALFGFAFYMSAPPEMAELKTTISLAVAIAPVIAGIIASHIAIRLGSWTWYLVIAYTALEIIGLLEMNLTSELTAVGVVIVLLTLIVYVARSLYQRYEESQTEEKTEREQERADELAEKEWQRQLELKRLEMEQQERLAKIEAGKEKAIAKASVKPVSNEDAKFDSKMPPEERRAQILQEYLTNQDVSILHLAGQFNVSRQTVYNDLKALEDEGQLHKNGEGYKVT